MGHHHEWMRMKMYTFENTLCRRERSFIHGVEITIIVKNGEWSCILDHCFLHVKSLVVDDERGTAEKRRFHCSLLPLMYAIRMHYLGWWHWPLTLTLDLDLYIFKHDLHAKFQNLYVCVARILRRTDEHKDTQTKTMSKLLHPLLMQGVITRTSCKLKIIGQNW